MTDFSSLPRGMRLCPTRIDAEHTLVAHTIKQSMCQTRQREHYHKCGTCEHNNARVAEVARTAPKAAAAKGEGKRAAV